MKVLIIEDERMAAEKLARMLAADFPDVEVIGTTASVEESVAWLKDPANRPDLIFMDVELGDGDCFEIFRQVKINASVVMTTAYDHYAVKAFEAGSIDYLLKPLERAGLRRAVERCRAQGGGADIAALLAALGVGTGAAAPPAPRTYKERIIVRLGEQIIPVNTSDIAYFYSENKSNYIATCSGARYITDLSMDAIAGELNPEEFFKISRNGIVSLKSIKSITRQMGGRLRITVEPEPPFEMIVARARVDDFLKWIE